MPNSMTGFSCEEHKAEWGELSCEIRSVNHRYLEPIIRLPEHLRVLEPKVRDQLRKLLCRGKVEVSVQLTLADSNQQGLQINQSLLKSVISAATQMKESYQAIGPIDPIRLLGWPGVVLQEGIETDVIQRAAHELVEKTLAGLTEHRNREGKVLRKHIEERLCQIDELVNHVKGVMPEVITKQKVKLQQRLDELEGELDQVRIEQEIVLIANKVDVNEELDRLVTHLDEVRHILRQQGPIGRRLDFMMQELNREANTLSSKSIASETSQVAVSIKVLIEQMREQIQNIE